MKKHLFLFAVIAFVGGQFLSGQDHHWPLTTDLTDVVGGLNGTNNGVTFENDAVRGPVAYFNGDVYANLPSFIEGLTEITIGCWFRMDEVRIWSRIYSFGRGDQTEPKDVMMVIPVSDATEPDSDPPHKMFRFTLKPLGDQWYDIDFPKSKVDIQVNTWYYSTIVLKPDSIIVYHDGVQVFAESGYPNAFGTIADSENALGKSFWPDPLYKGAISDLRVYNSALSEAEVAALYEATSPTGIENHLSENAPNVYSYLDKIHVELNHPYTDEVVSVYSTTGALVAEIPVPEIGLMNFRSGIYVVKVEGSKVSHAVKVFIK